MDSFFCRLLRRIVSLIFGDEMKVPFTMKGRPILIDFKTKFNKYDYMSCLESALSKPLPNAKEIDENDAGAVEYLLHLCEEAKISTINTKASCGKLLEKLFDHYVEPELAQPTFIMDYPQSLSPLGENDVWLK